MSFEKTTATELEWDPEPLTPSQRSGDACVYCSKVYPRPRCRVGVLGEPSDTELPGAAKTGVDELGTPGAPLFACDDCADIDAH